VQLDADLARRAGLAASGAVSEPTGGPVTVMTWRQRRIDLVPGPGETSAADIAARMYKVQEAIELALTKLAYRRAGFDVQFEDARPSGAVTTSGTYPSEGSIQ
jgi:hypothetical protein